MNPEMRHHARKHPWDPASAGLLLAGAAICAATIGVFAQAAPAQRGASPPAQRGAPPPAQPTTPETPRRYVVIGCIAREAQPAAAAGRGSSAARFTITDKRSDKPTTYRLQGDAKELDLHVGHTMEVAGTLAPPTGAGRGSTALVLNVASLTWISTSCQK